MNEKNLIEFENNNKYWKLFFNISTGISIGYFLLLFFNISLGDYNFFFFFASLYTGIIWFKERFSWKKDELYAKNFAKKKPYWIDISVDVFPFVFTFFIIRAFIGEPFKIPSGSMEPSLYTGDIVLANKFNYGSKLPLINQLLFKNNDVQRGDIVVFKYPPNPNIYYIKRIIGLPGDKLQYYFQEKKLIINDKEIEKNVINSNNHNQMLQYFVENLEQNKHKIQLQESLQLAIPTGNGFLNKESCKFDTIKIECNVPVESYFVMGDNRDNSLDSRFWGFVPYSNILGNVNYAFNLFKLDFKHLN